MREPVAIGFYPGDKKQLESAVKKLLVPKQEIKNSLGIISPHAGYIYSGAVAGEAFASAKTDKKNFILMGPNHTGIGSPASLSAENWKTPLGEVRVNSELVERFSRSLRVDESAHRNEHSLEVQLPFIQAMYSNPQIVPLCLAHIGFSEIEKLAYNMLDENSFYIASSDFIHFGSNYGYVPVSGSMKVQLGWTKSVDKRLIELICELKARDFYTEIIENSYTVCGFIPITLMILIMKKLGAKRGHLIDYRTSYDVQPSDSFVSYAGIAFE